MSTHETKPGDSRPPNEIVKITSTNKFDNPSVARESQKQTLPPQKQRETRACVVRRVSNLANTKRTTKERENEKGAKEERDTRV